MKASQSASGLKGDSSRRKVEESLKSNQDLSSVMMSTGPEARYVDQQQQASDAGSRMKEIVKELSTKHES